MHELHCYDYVNQPYATVRAAVLSDPQELFRMATGSQLHVRIGALELGAEIEIEISRIDHKCEPFERPITTIDLAWRSRRGQTLFPLMTASLKIYPLTPTETQLELSGTYHPPLGVIGQAVDAVAMHKLAAASVASFIREVAAYLRRSLLNPATATA
jgi:hypothetical protein